MRGAVRLAGYQHMANPKRYAQALCLLQKRLGMADGLSGHRLIERGVDVLDVVKNQVGMAEDFGIIALTYAGGIQTGMNALALEQL